MPDGAFNIVQYNTGGCAAGHSGGCGGSSLVGFGGDLGAGRPAGKGGIFALRHRRIAGIDGVLRSGGQVIKGNAVRSRLPRTIGAQPILHAVKCGNRDAGIRLVINRGRNGGVRPGRDGQARRGVAGVVILRGRCAELNRHRLRAVPAERSQGHIVGAVLPLAWDILSQSILHSRGSAGQGLVLIVDGG